MKEHWSLIRNQPLLKTIFTKPPIISYKKGKSLKDMLVRAKISFPGDDATRPQKPHAESMPVCLYLYSKNSTILREKGTHLDENSALLKLQILKFNLCFSGMDIRKLESPLFGGRNFDGEEGIQPKLQSHVWEKSAR